MRHTKISDMECPIARGLDRVGEWWSMLILRDAFHGLTRFDQFQKSLPIAPNMLTRRLGELVEAGLLERRRYSEKPPRDDYVLTDKGRDFWPVLVAMSSWGNRWFAPEGVSSQLVEVATGRAVDPILTDPVNGRPIDGTHYHFAAGPAASEAVRRRLDFADRHREKTHG